MNKTHWNLAHYKILLGKCQLLKNDTKRNIKENVTK